MKNVQTTAQRNVFLGGLLFPLCPIINYKKINFQVELQLSIYAVQCHFDMPQRPFLTNFKGHSMT